MLNIKHPSIDRFFFPSLSMVFFFRLSLHTHTHTHTDIHAHTHTLSLSLSLCLFIYIYIYIYICICVCNCRWMYGLCDCACIIFKIWSIKNDACANLKKKGKHFAVKKTSKKILLHSCNWLFSLVYYSWCVKTFLWVSWRKKYVFVPYWILNLFFHF